MKRRQDLADFFFWDWVVSSTISMQNAEKTAIVRFLGIFRYYRTTIDLRRAKWEQLFKYNQMDKEAGSLDDVNERGL